MEIIFRLLLCRNREETESSAFNCQCHKPQKDGPKNVSSSLRTLQESVTSQANVRFAFKGFNVLLLGQKSLDDENYLVFGLTRYYSVSLENFPNATKVFRTFF